MRSLRAQFIGHVTQKAQHFSSPTRPPEEEGILSRKAVPMRSSAASQVIGCVTVECDIQIASKIFLRSEDG